MRHPPRSPARALVRARVPVAGGGNPDPAAQPRRAWEGARVSEAVRLRLGWQYATPCRVRGRRRAVRRHRRQRLNPGWAAAQRREENLLNRPLQATLGVAAARPDGSRAGVARGLGVIVVGLGAICCA